LKDAEAVLIEIDIHQLEEKFSTMIPEFARSASEVARSGKVLKETGAGIY
jgi:hypothetical protein